MSNNKLPSKLIPYSTMLWWLRKKQLHQITDELQQMSAILLSFEIRYQDVCGTDNTTHQNTNQSHKQQKYRINRNLFKEVALFLHPDHITQRSDKEERYNDMIRASQAYHNGDEQELEALLYKWKMREIAGSRYNVNIEEWSSEIYSLCIEKARINRSSMWALAMRELEYINQGRDLLAELAMLMQQQK
jgi:hypothetical protein